MCSRNAESAYGKLRISVVKVALYLFGLDASNSVNILFVYLFIYFFGKCSLKAIIIFSLMLFSLCLKGTEEGQLQVRDKQVSLLTSTDEPFQSTHSFESVMLTHSDTAICCSVTSKLRLLNDTEERWVRITFQIFICFIEMFWSRK